MKKLLAIVLCLLTICSLMGCGAPVVLSKDTPQIHYKYMDLDISESLTEEETATVRKILGGKIPYWDDGYPMCGYSENVSITIGDRTFSLACDGCHDIQIVGEDLYISLSDSEWAKMEAIFEAHGGSFPCV